MALCRLRTLRAALHALPQPLNIACAWQHTPHATSPRLRCPCHAPACEPPWGTTTHVHGWSPIAVRQCPHCTPKLKSPAYDRIHYLMHTHDSDTMQYTMQHTLHYPIAPKRKALPGQALLSHPSCAPACPPDSQSVSAAHVSMHHIVHTHALVIMSCSTEGTRTNTHTHSQHAHSTPLQIK